MFTDKRKRFEKETYGWDLGKLYMIPTASRLRNARHCSLLPCECPGNLNHPFSLNTPIPPTQANTHIRGFIIILTKQHKFSFST